jgi:hypothetical protein
MWIDHAGARPHDVALGLSEMRPYVIVANPRVPLLDNGVLQVAAEVREIDDASITFPPVGLQAKREAHDRLLRCPLDALTVDADQDGATDIEEARLGTDPAIPDTDGDGLLDGADPSPLGGARPSSPEDQVWLATMQEIVAPHSKGEMLITVTSGPRLDLRGVPFTLLVLRKEELDAYTARFGFKVTFDVGVKVTGTDEAEVEVSYGWEGASYNAKRTARGWVFTSGGRWVTEATVTPVGALAARE